MPVKIKLNMAATDEQLIHMFDALGDSSRFKIFKVLLNNKNICVSEIAETLGISTSAVSQHLKILELSGLTLKHRQKQMICYEAKRSDALVKCIIKLFY